MFSEILQLVQDYPWWVISIAVIFYFLISLARKLGDKLGDDIYSVIKEKFDK